MSLSTEFLNYCSEFLDTNFGAISEGMINKVLSKKKLDDSSNISDIEEFINYIEYSIGVISGKSNATAMCKHLREKTMELNLITETTEIKNSFRTEATDININEFLSKIHVGNIIKDIKPIAEKRMQPVLPVRGDAKGDMDIFLMRNVLPAEGEITRFSADIQLKYGGNGEKIKKDIIEKVKANLKNEIDKKHIKAEINKFLFKYPFPAKPDVDDFVNYISLLKLKTNESELREQIETERLFRKFQDPILMEKTSEIDKFINLIKGFSDKNDIIRTLEERELSYLIKDDTGISDRLLLNLVERIILIEKDSLGGIYLKHIVRKTSS
ncbi:MAG: hypothetical protein KKA10_18380 [Euryarchaeota archaeon]|nr:hypothetical protein [Euryarchaeota archaeon]